VSFLQRVANCACWPIPVLLIKNFVSFYAVIESKTMQKLKSEMKSQVEIEEILHAIEVNFHPSMGYKELCGLTQLSVRQLIEQFKKINTTPMMFIRSLKNEVK
jgi:transcriptional regulator GlxA family with amidase domain